MDSISKLLPEHLEKLKAQVSDDVSLEEILIDQFPSINITIIRGFDNFSFEAYTKEAYFTINEAKEAMHAIRPNGTLPDTYHVLTGTVVDLENGKICDQRTKRSLDEVDRSIVYWSLQKRLDGDISDAS